MAAIRSKDTTPELAVRRFLHREGYRFNVGRRIAGYRPDIVFTRRRKAVFVHGCFWHSHACGADSDEAARVNRALSAHRSDLMPPIILI
jgi:DNA mismatch endonuclease, patch repair protein